MTTQTISNGKGALQYRVLRLPSKKNYGAQYSSITADVTQVHNHLMGTSRLLFNYLCIILIGLGTGVRVC